MSASSRRRRDADTRLSAGRKTVLVVEDDTDIRATLRFALEDEGYAVESAGDGLSALRKARQSRPDLVILDLNMPRMGGEDFLYAWRTGVETPGVPVIVITATSQALRPEDLGVEAYLPKPFNVDELLQRIEDLLAMQPQLQEPDSRDPRGAEMVDVVDDLANAMSTVLLSAEQLAASDVLPDNLRIVASGALDATQRASALVRRLNHLINALK